MSESFLASIIVTNQVGLGVPRRRTGQDSPEKVPLVPEPPEGFGFIKISVRKQPQVVPGEVPVGQRENSFMERVRKHWKRLPRAEGTAPIPRGGFHSPADVTLGDTVWDLAGL